MTRIRKFVIAMAILMAMAVAAMLILPMSTRASGETVGDFTITATN